jgi:hypothetical protein
MFKSIAIAGVGGALLAACLAAAPAAHAFPIQSPGECAVGKRVATRDGHQGVITRVDRAWSYCYVRQDDTGREVGYLYSLLESIGGPARASDMMLPSGVYECVGNGSYTFINMRITGPRSYVLDRHPGSFRIEQSGRIVFESGPLKPYHARLLPDHRIGLNANGDNSFYATSCELNRNLR